MTTPEHSDEGRKEQGQAPRGEKRAYRSPALTRLGSVRELTLAGGSSRIDNGQFGTRKNFG